MNPNKLIPSVAELETTVDGTGVVNFTKLHDLCVQRLTLIHAEENRYFILRGERLLSNKVHRFLSARNFAHPGAPVTRWFFEQPMATFNLQQNAR